MRKAIKIILTILLIIAIILVVVWFRARRQAVQQGQQAPSFRQFLGLGTVAPNQQSTTPETGLSSDFTTPSDTASTGTTDDTNTGSGTATSQFTSGPISPTQSNSGNGSSSTTPGKQGSGGSSGSNGGNGIVGTGGNGDVIPPPHDVNTPPATTSAQSSQCTDADLTIQFTPDEINRLNELQNRFYAIAGKLHTDGDVQNEVANHDEFKAKVDQITELYNYCVAKAPLITAPLYATRITTPFWRDATRDGSGYWWNRPNGVTFIDLPNDTQDPRNPMMSQASIEQILKVNLW